VALAIPQRRRDHRGRGRRDIKKREQIRNFISEFKAQKKMFLKDA
jgi:hypothetical protein